MTGEACSARAAARLLPRGWPMFTIFRSAALLAVAAMSIASSPAIAEERQSPVRLAQAEEGPMVITPQPHGGGPYSGGSYDGGGSYGSRPYASGPYNRGQQPYGRSPSP